MGKLSPEGEQTPKEGIPYTTRGKWPESSSPALQSSLSPLLHAPFSLLPSFLFSHLLSNCPLSSLTLPLPPLPFLLFLSLPLHHPERSLPTWLFPKQFFRVLWSVAPSAPLCPLGEGCYFRYPQGLTQRSRVLPAPKLGRAAFHRHKYKHLYMTYRHTHTHLDSNIHTLREPFPTSTWAHRHLQKEESELPLAKAYTFQNTFTFRI